MVDVCFVTVCGGGEEYEYLLGSIEHHAAMGRHVVLDTSPPGKAVTFKKLPPTVRWFRSTSFGAGWDGFRFADALNYAVWLAEAMAPDVLVQLDCDDFFTPELGAILSTAEAQVVELQYVHWLKDQRPYLFGESEWHRRVWPPRKGIRFQGGGPMAGSNDFVRNPQVHPSMKIPDGVRVARSKVLCRNHVHFAVGEKAEDTRIARQSITGWPHGKIEVAPALWPERLRGWLLYGRKPSEAFL